MACADMAFEQKFLSALTDRKLRYTVSEGRLTLTDDKEIRLEFTKSDNENGLAGQGCFMRLDQNRKEKAMRGKFSAAAAAFFYSSGDFCLRWRLLQGQRHDHRQNLLHPPTRRGKGRRRQIKGCQYRQHGDASKLRGDPDKQRGVQGQHQEGKIRNSSIREIS